MTGIHVFAICHLLYLPATAIYLPQTSLVEHLTDITVYYVKYCKYVYIHYKIYAQLTLYSF